MSHHFRLLFRAGGYIIRKKERKKERKKGKKEGKIAQCKALASSLDLTRVISGMVMGHLNPCWTNRGDFPYVGIHIHKGGHSPLSPLERGGWNWNICR